MENNAAWQMGSVRNNIECCRQLLGKPHGMTLGSMRHACKLTLEILQSRFGYCAEYLVGRIMGKAMARYLAQRNVRTKRVNGPWGVKLHAIWIFLHAQGNCAERHLILFLVVLHVIRKAKLQPKGNCVGVKPKRQWLKRSKTLRTAQNAQHQRGSNATWHWVLCRPTLRDVLPDI